MSDKWTPGSWGEEPGNLYVWSIPRCQHELANDAQVLAHAAAGELRAEVARLREERDAARERAEHLTVVTDIAMRHHQAEAESARAGESAALERVAEMEAMVEELSRRMCGGAWSSDNLELYSEHVTASVRSEIDPPRGVPK